MEVFEKARLALREHLLKNKERVLTDLEQMREKSAGNDIFKYVEHVANSFSFESVTAFKEFSTNYTFDKDILTYLITGMVNEEAVFSPPGKSKKYTKKDSEVSSESFFLISLQYDRSKEGRIFVC
jgi:hypothetical protein